MCSTIKGGCLTCNCLVDEGLQGSGGGHLGLSIDGADDTAVSNKHLALPARQVMVEVSPLVKAPLPPPEGCFYHQHP